MQRGQNRKEWHYQLEYFEDEKRQSPLMLSHFPLFKFKITLKGFMKIRCQRTCVVFGIRTRTAADQCFIVLLHFFFFDFSIFGELNEGLILRKLTSSQSCLSGCPYFRVPFRKRKLLTRPLDDFAQRSSTSFISTLPRAYPWSLCSIVALSSFSKLSSFIRPAVWKRRKGWFVAKSDEGNLSVLYFLRESSLNMLMPELWPVLLVKSIHNSWRL